MPVAAQLRIYCVLVGLLACGDVSARLLVTEVLYDPKSAEDRWEWIEVYNSGTAAIDLDGYVIDRVGDRERTEVLPNIQSQPLFGDRTVSNPTVIPAGGIAVLYNGEGLGYSADRFRAAWPATTSGTVLIGVEGWSSNQLTNSPNVSDYAPSLPAMTVGLWEDEAAYRLDAADFGGPGSPNRRIFRTDNAAAAFGYDDDPPWRDALGRSAIHYIDGPIFEPTSWGRSNAPWGGASKSRLTFQPEPINQSDYGSPGIAPIGNASRPGLIITEIMANPASITGATNEWEWVEVYNNGPTIDFAATPHWFDDDDGLALAEANLTSGRIAHGETAVLFNASAVSLEQMRTAWDRPDADPINWIAIESWPLLANGGDRVGLWDDAIDYSRDQLVEGGSIARAVAGVEYDDAAPWPTGVDGDAIRLLNLGSDPEDPGAWARARGAFADPAAYPSADVLEPGGVVDNAGGDQASPGFIWPDITPPLRGDYNGDGLVNAIDYTLFRDGAPLPTEFATAGVTDAADYVVWHGGYGRGQSAAVAIPEPDTVLTAMTSLAGAIAACRCRFR
ncbi:MAG: lamin tail domain-containing protein [Planctomycetota bacterium]